MAVSKTHGFNGLPQTGREVVLAADFDDHGTRLVTGSADHRIRVFDLQEKTAEWKLTDVWRAHNAAVTGVKWKGGMSREVVGSIGEDLKLKIWQEDEAESKGGGRRWKNVFAQSSSRAIVYQSLDFVNVRHETFLALVTRDGLLSLLEPVNPLGFDDWKEIDQVWVCRSSLGRGVESSFKVVFQHEESPNHHALLAGLDASALTLAVTALEQVKIYRIVTAGRDGPYRFQATAAELGGAQGLVRDVAWAPNTFRPCDQLATASSDGYVRVYEMWTTAPNTQDSQQPAISRRGPSGIGAGLAGASRNDSDWSLEADQVVHESKMVAELKQEGAWKVEWLRGGTMLVATGDNGRAMLWSQEGSSWTEFADFGPTQTEDDIVRPR